MRIEYNKLTLNWIDDVLTDFSSFTNFIDSLGAGIYYFTGRSGQQMSEIGLPGGNYLLKVYQFRTDRTYVEAHPYTLNQPIYYLRKYSSSWSTNWEKETVKQSNVALGTWGNYTTPGVITLNKSVNEYNMIYLQIGDNNANEKPMLWVNKNISIGVKYVFPFVYNDAKFIVKFNSETEMEITDIIGNPGSGIRQVYGVL